VLGQLRWAWMPAVIMLESSSMVAFARMHRRLLAAGRARFGLGPMLATAKSSGSGPGGWVSCSFLWRAGRW
jgi:hypothetical protein